MGADVVNNTVLVNEVLAWLRPQLGAAGGALLVGVNGPQGAGKTTLTRALCAALAAEGRRATAVSVDDFYLTGAEQDRLAAAHPGNPYLQQRGYPGTHDVALGARVLAALRAREPGEVRVPRYDKSARAGEGDRAPEAGWSTVPTPLDVIFLEGWMLGFRPASPADASLREIDALLPRYEAWHALLDSFLLLEPLDYRYVLDWRVEAEERMKAEGKPGMSTERIRAYVRKFLPAYETWAPGLKRFVPAGGGQLRILLGKDRAPRGPSGNAGQGS